MRSISLIAASMVLAVSLGQAAAAQDQPAPTANPAAPQNPPLKSPGQVSGPLAAGENSFTKGEAKARIEAAGYAGVTGLWKDQDGLWHGQANRNGQPVKVSLDYKGDVASD